MAEMTRLAILAVLIFTICVLTYAETLDEFRGDWGERALKQNYYPNDTLNLITLGVINGKKYFFADQEASWFEASYFCNAHGMDLASIETQHENDLIVEHITKLGWINKFTIWLSGHNIGTTSWIWINGEFVIFSDWEIGQPNRLVNDHCIFIYEGKWHDGNCLWRGGSGHGGFICEERETFQKSKDQSELRGIYATDLLNLVTLDPTTGKQYLFANVSATWMEASYFCNAHGMDLVTIESQKENDLIMDHIQSLGMSIVMVYWTSAHKIGRSTWLWINGENVIYSDWEPGQPDQTTTAHCMHLFNSNWHDNICRWTSGGVDDLAAFICETRELPPGNGTEITYYPADMMNLVTLGPGNGKKYLVANQSATWFEASYFCNAHGMDLVTIETQEENDALVDYLASQGQKVYASFSYLRGFDTSYAFTSGHKIGRATYLWINGEYMLYDDWAPGEPSQQDTENCLIFLRNDWYDLPCNWTAPRFICEERIVQTNSKANEFRLS